MIRQNRTSSYVCLSDLTVCGLGDVEIIESGLCSVAGLFLIKSVSSCTIVPLSPNVSYLICCNAALFILPHIGVINMLDVSFS